MQQLKITGKFDKADIINDKIEFETRFKGEDLKQFGYSYWSNAIFVNYEVTGYGTIDLKDNKYRVTIFKMDSKVPDPNSKGSTVLKEYLTDKKGFRTGKNFTKAMDFYEKYLTQLFTITPSKDDW